MKKVLPFILMLLLVAGTLKAQQPTGNGNDLGIAKEQVENVIFIPNAFTPNDDGVNDVFYIPDIHFPSFEITVVDRWGNRVFQSNRTDFQWDGRANGKAVPVGVYVYVLAAVDSKGVQVKRSGTLNLMR